MTFELEEITDEVAKKVVYAKYMSSSGLGGTGSIIAITEDGQEYFLDLHGYDTYEKEWEVLKRFLGKDADGKEHIAYSGSRGGFKDMGSWLWGLEYGNRIFVRKDFFDRYVYAFDNRDKDEPYHFSSGIVRNLLNPQNKIPKMIYRKTAEIQEKEERERREREEWQVRNRLVEGEDYEWKTFGNGYCELCYLLLFEEDKDGAISGSKWTILYQKEQFEEGGIRSDAPTEAYNLYYKRYKNMGGILKYPEEGEDKEIYEYSTLTDGIDSYGEFRRTYFTLEQAKSAALKRNEFLGWGNYYKTNLLKRNWSEMSLEEAKKDYFRAVKRENELQLLFPKICGEFLRILSKYKYNQLYKAKEELTESLGLSENDIRIIDSFFRHVSMFTENGLEEAEKLLEEAKEYDV